MESDQFATPCSTLVQSLCQCCCPARKMYNALQLQYKPKLCHLQAAASNTPESFGTDCAAKCAGSHCNSYGLHSILGGVVKRLSYAKMLRCGPKDTWMFSMLCQINVVQTLHCLPYKYRIGGGAYRLGSRMLSSCSAYTFWEAVNTTTSYSCATLSRNSNRNGRCLTATVFSRELNLTVKLKSAASLPSSVECTCEKDMLSQLREAFEYTSGFSR